MKIESIGDDCGERDLVVESEVKRKSGGESQDMRLCIQVRLFMRNTTDTVPLLLESRSPNNGRLLLSSVEKKDIAQFSVYGLMC